MSGQGWWYLTRASGIIAWVLLGASVALGTMQSSRRTPGRSPAWFVDLHRGLAGIACWALATHLVALIADSFESFDLLDLLIPYRAPVEPGGVAWGIAALYVTVAVEATSLAARRLSWRTWRTIHASGLVVFWLTTLHAIQTGTDTQSWLLRIAAVAVSLFVAVVTVVRFLPPRRPVGIDKDMAV
jgi:methionine sulfoxide reductase heme-binding subunit